VLSPEEYYSLEYLFRWLVLKDHFAFSIFGDKPLSVSDFYTFDNSKCFHSHDLGNHNLYLRNGCKIWEKYKNCFPMKNHLILVEPEVDCNVGITVVNKKYFLNMFNKHREEFRKILGQDVTGEKLLSHLEAGNNLVEEVLHSNRYLLGILLGFGSKNAQLYQREEELHELQQNFWHKVAIYRTAFERTDPAIEQELEEIEKKFQVFEDPVKTRFLFSQLPLFGADLDDPETKELKKKYLRQRKEITKIYGNGKFLETTLHKLCS